MLLGILIVMPAFFVFIAVTMAPTWILAMRGSQTDSLSLQTMGAANFAGVLPYLIKLFQKGDTFSVAVSLLFQINFMRGTDEQIHITSAAVVACAGTIQPHGGVVAGLGANDPNDPLTLFRGKPHW
jgi:hypothetical protein